MSNFRILSLSFLFFIAAVTIQGQTRGSIPDVLLRPSWGESARYPADMVIGELGQGSASTAAYNYANSIAAGLLSGQTSHPALASINPVLVENYLSALGRIYPGSFRLGGGKEEPDEAVSFLLRFIGRDYGITGELYIRYVSRSVQGEDGEEIQTGSWTFDELLLEDAKSHDDFMQEFAQRNMQHRLDLLPFERFF